MSEPAKTLGGLFPGFPRLDPKASIVNIPSADVYNTQYQSHYTHIPLRILVLKDITQSINAKWPLGRVLALLRRVSGYLPS